MLIAILNCCTKEELEEEEEETPMAITPGTPEAVGGKYSLSHFSILTYGDYSSGRWVHGTKTDH